MWAGAYWGKRSWAGAYWGPASSSDAGGGYWAGTYWGKGYWAGAYWSPFGIVVVPPPTPPEEEPAPSGGGGEWPLPRTKFRRTNKRVALDEPVELPTSLRAQVEAHVDALGLDAATRERVMAHNLAALALILRVLEEQ